MSSKHIKSRSSEKLWILIKLANLQLSFLDTLVQLKETELPRNPRHHKQMAGLPVCGFHLCFYLLDNSIYICEQIRVLINNLLLNQRLKQIYVGLCLFATHSKIAAIQKRFAYPYQKFGRINLD